MFQTRLRLNNNPGLDRMDQGNDAANVTAGVSRIISAFRRQAKLFLACCFLGGAIGVVYLIYATPLYTATANIMIDKRQVRAVRDVSTFTDAPQEDSAEVSAGIESLVEVLHSEKVGLAVVRHFKLDDDPAFVNPPESRIGELWTFLKDKLGINRKTPKSSDVSDISLARQLAALKTLSANLRINRVGRTFVIAIEYTAANPVRAAEIANGFTDAFMLEELTSRIDETRRAQSWLKQRTEELRQLSVNADSEAQKFRADNNLLEAKGTLISEQEYNEMTSQLVNAEAETAKAKAQYLRLKSIIDNHQADSAVTESLANPIINELRTKYLDAANRMKELLVSRNLAPTHIAVVNLKNTMDELSARLFDELGRVADSYRNDYEIAAAREKTLNDNLALQHRVAVTANDAEVHLRQLEQKAESYKSLYQTFLQRYQETAQQETFPMSDQHVISVATPPIDRSFPRKPIVFAISAGIGALAGISIGMLRELMDRVFRTAEQVRDELGIDALGLLPIVAQGSLPKQVPGKSNMAPIMRYAIDDPFSAFAETLRSAKVAADLALQDRSPKIIGVASLLPKEGKSTVAKNFASLLALQGAKTLLIDADTRNPSLTRAIGCERRQDSHKDPALPRLSELLKVEPDSGLQILPCIFAKEDPRVADGFSAPMLHTLMQGSDQAFQYIILDLPPVGPVVNARGLASAIDAFIFVVAWGTTSRGAVRTALEREPSIKDKLLGVVLNKVDMKNLKNYEHFASDGYYHGLYKKYYRKPE